VAVDGEAAEPRPPGRLPVSVETMRIVDALPGLVLPGPAATETPTRDAESSV
jgi:hypothetical protein